MRKSLFVFMVLSMLGLQGLFAQQPVTLKLYNQGPEESNGIVETESVGEAGRIYNVTDPRIIVWQADKSKATGQAVVVCPGGGYGLLAADHEGTEVAKWLNLRGITAVVLIYRMPNGHHQIPLKDAQRAIEMTRANAKDWNIDADKVGIMGFSAGGHLAASAMTLYTSEANKPSFGILFYPVVSFDDVKYQIHKGTRRNLLGEANVNDKQLIDRYSTERHVNSQTPPCYIVLGAEDKSVPPVNSLAFAQAMVEAQVPVELHLYPEGMHGFGFGIYRPFKYRGEAEVNLDRWLKEQN